jgi:hypothetical protein
MDPINWAAVAVSATLAALIGLGWYGRLFPAQRSSLGIILGSVVLQAVSALMLGHALARIGADKLAIKPALFWMQCGGIALAFIIPALFMTGARRGVAAKDMAVDAGFWLVVYLLTGTVFWLLA